VKFCGELKVSLALQATIISFKLLFFIHCRNICEPPVAVVIKTWGGSISAVVAFEITPDE